MIDYPNLAPPVCAASPIVTRFQMEAELLGLALQKSPKVVAARDKGRADWAALAHPRDEASLASLDDAADQLTYFGVVNIANLDPLNPDILRTEVLPHRWGQFAIPSAIGLINNPDTIYRRAYMHGNSRYVLHGRLPVHPAIDLSISVLTPGLVTTSPPITGANLIADADGAFVVTIDSSAGQPGTNHLRIAPDTMTELLVRDTILDPTVEKPMSLCIQRVAGPPANPAPSFAQLEDMAAASVAQSFQIAFAVERLVQKETVNHISQPEVRGYGGFLATQANNITHLAIAEDEAFVMTVAMGEARYFSVPIGNRWQVNDQWLHRQVNLNNRIATANTDGTITVVISRRDPGVRNWLDMGGMSETVFQLRWQGLAVPPVDGQGPRVVGQKLVKLADLKANLPAGTPFVTPEQREQMLRQRASDYAFTASDH